MGLLMHCSVFADSHKHCAMRESVVMVATFSVKRALDETFCPAVVLYIRRLQKKIGISITAYCPHSLDVY